MHANKLKRGQAKVAFYTCLDEVVRLLNAGYDIKAICERLREAGKITMSYTTFHANFVTVRPNLSASTRLPLLESPAPMVVQAPLALSSPTTPAVPPALMRSSAPA